MKLFDFVIVSQQSYLLLTRMRTPLGVLRVKLPLIIRRITILKR